jgi:poly-gamma-glutamate synthesis protein (capsule biosynthesis protein)
MIFLFCLSLYIAYTFDGKLKNQASNEQKTDTKPPKTNDKNDNEQNNITDKEPINTPQSSEVTLSSVGDCTIGWDDKFPYAGSLGDVFKRNNNDYSYFFKNVADIFKSDDITTANLETTFTNATAKAEKQFNFKAPPEFVKSLTLGSIEGVTISNNHTRDYLEQGFTDTKNTLKKENINYFGEGQKWITEIKGNKFGFLGYKGFSYDKTYLKNLKNDIEALKKENCIVVINFHWGDEGKYIPNDVQKYLAHYSIDNGADLIIGHHPHVIQGIENYKGKLIAYSLGNFCFGGNKNPPDKDTFILQTKFKFEDKKLKSYGIRAIPCSVSSVSNLNDYSPIPLEGNRKDAFLKKINNYSSNLNFKLKDDFYFIDVNN